jgi:hypothetical protein
MHTTHPNPQAVGFDSQEDENDENLLMTVMSENTLKKERVKEGRRRRQ